MGVMKAASVLPPQRFCDFGDPVSVKKRGRVGRDCNRIFLPPPNAHFFPLAMFSLFLSSTRRSDNPCSSLWLRSTLGALGSVTANKVPSSDSGVIALAKRGIRAPGGYVRVSAAAAVVIFFMVVMASASLLCPSYVDASGGTLSKSQLLADRYSQVLGGPVLSLRAGLTAFTAAAMAVAFGRLVTAHHPASAIFSFLALVLALVLALFSLSAEYMAALHLIIYPGAILIFFVFATLTTEQRWFSPEAENAQRRSPKEKTAAAVAALLSGALLAAALLTTAAPALSLGLASGKIEPVTKEIAISFGQDASGPVALGTAIFTRYRFALTLLGALLLLALLVALRLLSPALRRSGRGSGAFSLRRRRTLSEETFLSGNARKLDGGLAALPIALSAQKGAGADAVALSLGCSNSADALLTLALVLLATGFGALVHRSYSFLHFFLVIEAVGLALNLLFTAAAVTTATPEGEVWVTFGAAIAAAETAVGLALFLALVLSAPQRTPAVTTAGARARVPFRATC